MKEKEPKLIHEGLITESLPNGMFRVRLDNEDLILGYISGNIRRNFIRILPGDRVKIEVSGYDPTKGRIIYRLRNKDSKDRNKNKDSKNRNKNKDSKNRNKNKDSKD
uniref:Translation initiation factor IF-1, chloroplastic n=1 Tax=Lepiniopsis trilocularis TaxID=396315 RepID=A0A2S1UDT9_9GENT|nr:translation initiation factor 1 [Lepiniopsis trilocularis]